VRVFVCVCVRVHIFMYVLANVHTCMCLHERVHSCFSSEWLRLFEEHPLIDKDDITF